MLVKDDVGGIQRPPLRIVSPLETLERRPLAITITLDQNLLIVISVILSVLVMGWMAIHTVTPASASPSANSVFSLNKDKSPICYPLTETFVICEKK